MYVECAVLCASHIHMGRLHRKLKNRPNPGRGLTTFVQAPTSGGNDIYSGRRKARRGDYHGSCCRPDHGKGQLVLLLP